MAQNNQFDDLPKERSSGTVERNKRVLEIIIAIISILFIIILCGMNYVKPLDKMYSPEAFYKGANQVANREDPVAVYNQMRGEGKGARFGACQTKFLTVGADKLLTWRSTGNAIPRIMTDSKGFDPANVATWAEQFSGATLGIDGNDNRWYLWNDAGESDDMRIIAPWKSFKFVNSNFKAGSDRRINVSAAENGDYISFVNVANWYCHMDLDEYCTEHTTRVGKNADDTTLRGFSSLGDEFTILGKATTETYMVGMKKDSGGTYVECSPAEVLGLN